MNSKLLIVIGLTFLIVSHTLLFQGFDFLQAQKPIDFAHWFMLIGAVMMLSFKDVFPKSIFNTIATALVMLGVIAHVGMCTIDFILWSFKDDYEGRNQVISLIMNTPSIRLPFLVIGPSLLYIGLSFHVWKFITSHTLLAIITIAGSLMVGLGQFLPGSRIFTVIGMVIFSIGLVLLVYRKEKSPSI